MTTKRYEVGFNQRLQLNWLEQTANLFLTGQTKPQIQIALNDMLRDQLSTTSDQTKPTGNRGNAISNLIRIWVNVPAGLETLRNDGLEHLMRLPTNEHLPIHWGMSMAVYPFFGSVAEIVGQQFRLQGNASSAHIQRRLKEQFGERETVARSARRILRCFLDWGVLEDTAQKGTYQPAPTHIIEDISLALWLIEAVLLSRDLQTAILSTISQHPAIFPFELPQITSRTIDQSKRFTLFRQNLDEDVLLLNAVQNLC